MASATRTSKGQFTLPKSVRARSGIEAGDQLEFIGAEQGFLVVAATRDIRSLKGIVGRPKKPATLEDTNSAIEMMGRTLWSGLDTNVVIRYLTQDEAKQSPIATRL